MSHLDIISQQQKEIQQLKKENRELREKLGEPPPGGWLCLCKIKTGRPHIVPLECAIDFDR